MTGSPFRSHRSSDRCYVSIVCITARPNPGLGRLLDSIKDAVSGIEDMKDPKYVEIVYGDRLWEERQESVIHLLKDSGLRWQYVRDTPTQPGPSPGGARNACIDAARGDWIISIDDLTFLTPEVIARHWELYREGFDAVAGSFLSLEEGGEPFEDDSRVTGKGGVIAPVDGTIWQSWWGMHTGFSKKAWQRINGYDELFDGVYGMEDIDFGHRLKASGCSMAWEPGLKVLCERGSNHNDTHKQLIPDSAPTSWVRGEVKWRNDKLIEISRACRVTRGMRR